MSISEALPLDVAGAPSPAPVVAAPRAAAVSALVSPAVVAREALIVAMLVAGLTALLAPRDLGFGVAPHPGWAAVILVSARYGSRGFGLALFAVWGTLTLTALAMGVSLGPLLSAAGNSVPDLIALVLSILVAWIASAHERRIDDLSVRGVELAQKSTGDDAIVAELQGAAMALRARADRVDHSVTFMRDVAARLEGGDPLLGSQAALELAIARTGSRAGVVQLVDERGRLRTVASLGAWTLLRARPPDVVLDRTIKAAFESGASVRAVDFLAELAEAGRDKSDVAMPITDEAGEVLGILALRGVPPDSLSHALVHDLGLIARWCAKANASRGLAVDRTTPARRNHPGARRRRELTTARPPGRNDSIEWAIGDVLGTAGGRHTASLAPPARAGHLPGWIGAGRAGPGSRRGLVVDRAGCSSPAGRRGGRAGHTGQPQSAGAHGGADAHAASPGRRLSRWSRSAREGGAKWARFPRARRRRRDPSRWPTYAGSSMGCRRPSH